MADTVRQLVVDAVVARMQNILVANGYETDCGALVEDWPRRFDASELPALAVCDLSDESEIDHREAGQETHTLTIQVRVMVAEATPAEFLRKAIGDVQKAIKTDLFWGELSTGTYPKRTGMIVPSEAMELAGAAIEFDVAYVTEPFNSLIEV